MSKFFLQLLSTMILGWLVVGCIDEKPNNTLTDDQLIEILVDVHLAEAALQNIYGKEKDSITEDLYAQVFAFNKIDSTTFRENLKSLRRNPKKLQEIYTMVVEELSVKETESLKRDKPKKK